MVKTLYLIRHGETEGAEVRRYKGSIDVPLSKKGIEQMKWVAEYMNKSYMSYKSHKTYNAIYCSDLSRAVKSAEIIAEPYGLKPIIVPELRERNFGIWEGMSFDEIKEKYPKEFDAWASNPLKFSPMEGESTIEVRDRVIKALDKILNNAEGQSIKASKHQRVRNSDTLTLGYSDTNIIVSHGGVNRIILCHFLGIPLKNIFRLEQDYGCLNIIEFWDKYPVVKAINMSFPQFLSGNPETKTLDSVSSTDEKERDLGETLLFSSS